MTPFYGEPTAIREGRVPQNETARPGYYRTTPEDISCELTVDGGVALHRYTFGHDSGRVAGIANISRTLGKIPCSFGLTDIFPCEEQAKMLGKR